MTTAELIESGREAMARNAWKEAFELWHEADAEGEITAEQLEEYAATAWWTGQSDECIKIRERAYTAYNAQGDETKAGALAQAIAEGHFHKGEGTIGMSWLKRAEDLLGTDGRTVESGWLIRQLSVVALEGDNDLERAADLSQRAYDAAIEHGDLNLQALSLHDRGRVTVASGDVEAGMRLMDEAMVAAVAGELDAMTTGRVYCNMIDICEQLADYRRAGDWSDAAKRWCERAGNNTGFPGICRVHRAEIMKLRGEWASAEEEAHKASDELSTFVVFTGEAVYEIGEIRLNMGDYEKAEEAFRQAHALGRDPQPGLAQLELARGNSDSAWALISRSIEPPLAPLLRARFLPTVVEVGLAAGQMDAAKAAAEELSRIADEFGTSALLAHSEHATGAVLLAAGDTSAACAHLRQATDLRLKDELPYLAARSRMLLGQAYEQEGDRILAELEYTSAKAAFQELGAVPDMRAAAQALDRHASEPDVGDRRVACLMFTDIVDSTALIGVIGDESWEALLRWHHRTLRALFTDHGGHEVENTGDGFFVAFDEGDEAVACGIEIQNKLAAHRREQGFSPQVRIGINRGEVTEVSSTLAGEEVHKAARICSAAGAGEILVTMDLQDQIPPGVGTTEKTVELKGFAEPEDVLSIIPV